MAAPTIRISIYKNFADTSGADTSIDLFLHDIQDGKWQDLVLPIRTEKDEKKRTQLKSRLPCVTVSGTFNERKDDAIKQHSGFIAIDIDKLGEKVESAKKLLSADPYVYACFTSVSGTGICVIIPIDSKKHRDAFEGIAKYLYETYQLIVDPAAKNESRLRYVSYDPHTYHNDNALKFKKYLPKEKKKVIPKAVFVQNDFDAIISELAPKNICEDYRTWITIGYSLASHFGEQGRHYFHALSATSSKYDSEDCDSQYSAILRNDKPKDKRAHIATIYYYAKINGITAYSDRTKQILSSTTTLRKSGLSQSGVISNLQKFEGIPASESQGIVEQAFVQDIDHVEDESVITVVENWLKYNHDIKRNYVTRRLENNGKIMQETDVNTIYLTVKKLYENITFDLFYKILFSDSTKEYNPFYDFFERYSNREPVGVIDSFWSCFHTAKGVNLSYFGSKWLIGIISAMHGTHSPLMLVFTGGQNSGKTEAFRRLLPDELRSYYAESKLDRDKDDEILMTQKIIIMDDEMGGKSKQESKRLKELTSKQTFSLRVPYGKGNEDLHRLAVLCGTSNDNAILNDPTGNRRIIPVEIVTIDHKAYNNIDKVDLFVEAYRLWKSGFEWMLTKEDIIQLNENTEGFEDYTTEYEHIQKYLLKPDNDSCFEWTCTEIKSYMERLSMQKLSLKKLGEELKRMGFEQTVKKANGKCCRVYKIIPSSQIQVEQKIF